MSRLGSALARSRARYPTAWRIGVAMLGVTLAALIGFAIVFRHDLRPKRLVELEPNILYRSGQISPRLVRKTIEELDIRLVVDLQVESNEPEQVAEAEAVRELGIDYVRLPLGGNGTGDPRSYVLAIAAIAGALERGEPTLVHCSAGARRTGGVIAMYKVLVAGQTPQEAYDELARFGSPSVSETPLLPYLNDNMGAIAEQLAELGVIATVPDPLPRFEPPSGD